MIAVEELLKQPPSLGNYFDFDAYVAGDFELGLIENRHGARLLALPDTLLVAIQKSLAHEVGDASRIVLFQCGLQWGKNFYRRFNQEVSEYYGKPLAQLEMVEFLQCLKQCWKTYGWGLLDIDVSYYNQGFLVAVTHNSGFAATRPPSEVAAEVPVCHTEAGLLSAFFSQLTGQSLHCVQTTCESLGADCNHFVLGRLDRVKPAEAWLAEKHDHSTIMERLCHGQTVPAATSSPVASPSMEVPEKEVATPVPADLAVETTPMSGPEALITTGSDDLTPVMPSEDSNPAPVAMSAESEEPLFTSIPVTSEGELSETASALETATGEDEMALPETPPTVPEPEALAVMPDPEPIAMTPLENLSEINETVVLETPEESLPTSTEPVALEAPEESLPGVTEPTAVLETPAEPLFENTEAVAMETPEEPLPESTKPTAVSEQESEASASPAPVPLIFEEEDQSERRGKDADVIMLTQQNSELLVQDEWA